VARLLFTSPTQAFAALKEKPVYVLPMLLTLIGVTVLTACYYSKVDIAWLQDQTLGSARGLTPDQQKAVAATMTRAVLFWSSTILAPVSIFVIMMLGALYYLIAGNVTNVRYSFGHWFAFSWWSSSPQIIGSLASILMIVLNRSTQIGTSAMQPLSLNELVFHRGVGQPGYTFLSSLGLIQVASVWLTYIGVKAWSGRSTLFCLVFTLLPTVVIYGVWAFFAFR